MRDALFITVAVLYLIAVLLTYMNRGSEKVITTFGIGLAALIFSIFAVVVFSSEPPTRTVFSVPIIIHADTRLPVEGFPYPILPLDLPLKFGKS